jgi:hypothetical protein
MSNQTVRAPSNADITLFFKQCAGAAAAFAAFVSVLQIFV